MPESAVRVEEGLSTYADYKKWELAPGERFELIYGVAYAMSAPNAMHQTILSTLNSEIHVFLKGKTCKEYPAPYDVRLFYEDDESDDTVVQPDISVICDPKKRGEEGCRGAPDLVIEILSPSNTAVEMQRKFELYQDAGVREYWSVDPEHKSVVIYILEKGRYYSLPKNKDGILRSSVLEGFSVSLETVFAE